MPLKMERSPGQTSLPPTWEEDAAEGPKFPLPEKKKTTAGNVIGHAREVLAWAGWDVMIVFVLFAAAMVTAVGYLLTTDYTRHYSAGWFAPSAMVAAGHGMVNPDLGQMKHLAQFIHGKADTWVPARDGQPVAGDLHWFQRDHPNLIYAVALFWYLFGYDWDVLIPLHALFFAVSVVLAYGIARVAMLWPFALATAVLFMVTPVHLHMIPEIRDYSKVPFILATLLVCALVVRRARPAWQVLGLAALLGACVGVGLGFRLDMTICILPAVVTFLVLMVGPWKRHLVLGPLAVLVFVAALYGAGKPSVDNMRENGTMASHNIGGGLFWKFDLDMGLTLPYYANLYTCNDHYIFETHVAYAYRSGITKERIGWMSPQYYDASKHYLQEYALLFPGDVLLRACGSLFRVLEATPADIQREYGRTVLIERITHTLAGPLKFAADYGRHLALAALLVITALRFRWGLFFLAVLLYFGGYPSLQFMPRHYFYLSLFPWWIIVFLVSIVICGPLRLLLPEGRAALSKVRLGWRGVRAPVLRVGAMLLLLALGIALPLYIVTNYQARVVTRYIERIAEAPRARLVTKPESKPEKGEVFLDLDAALAEHRPESPRGGVVAHYLVAVFSGSSQRVPLGLCYSSGFDFNNFSTDMPVQLVGPKSGEETLVFFPVYEREGSSQWRDFLGVTLPQDKQQFLEGIYVVESADDFSLWPTLFLLPGWHEQPPVLRLDWSSGSTYPPLLEDALRQKGLLGTGS